MIHQLVRFCWNGYIVLFYLVDIDMRTCPCDSLNQCLKESCRSEVSGWHLWHQKPKSQFPSGLVLQVRNTWITAGRRWKVQDCALSPAWVNKRNWPCYYRWWCGVGRRQRRAMLMLPGDDIVITRIHTWCHLLLNCDATLSDSFMTGCIWIKWFGLLNRHEI